jgi:hypothetical protein
MERVQLAEAAGVVGALAAPALLLARGRLHVLVALVLLLAAEVMLALALVPDQLELIVRSPARLAAALAGLAVLAAHPRAVPYVLAETARAKSRAMRARLRPGVAPTALRPRFLVGFPDTQFAESGREAGERAKPVAAGTRISSEGF